MNENHIYLAATVAELREVLARYPDDYRVERWDWDKSETPVRVYLEDGNRVVIA